MIDERRDRVALIVILVIAVVAATFLAAADTSAGAARSAQDRGLQRGMIVDRNGVPLAWTVNRGGKSVLVERDRSLALTVGYRDPRGHWQGLLKKYYSLLSGKQAASDWRTFFLNLRGISATGGIVRTTIDARLQRTAAAALGRAKGAIVALDPRTGEVLAMVSNPSCGANQLANVKDYARCEHDPAKPLLRRATELLLPPGSAFKIVTLSTAYDTGKFSRSSRFSGADAFGPSPYFDNSTYPSNVTRSDLTELTIEQALAFSDNFTFAHIGLTVGAPNLLKYARRFYIDRKIPFANPVAVSTIFNGETNPSNSEIARSSFGAPTDHVTPLQMSLVASVVANHGLLMAPHLVKSLEDRSGNASYNYENHPLGRVIRAKSAADVTHAMEFVVQNGSGYLAQINHVPVAGKTGTAASGAYFPHAWFITFAPAKHPIIAVAVLHEFSGEGFKYAAPLARKVLIADLQEHGYKVK